MPRSSQTFHSPRHLVFRQGQRLLKSVSKAADDPVGLPPGKELLHSYEIPGLQTGPHTISVVQSITAGAVTEVKSSEQQFNVIGPRFQLPDNAIHSTYPPQGHSDVVECLPHVTFNDPTFPWERYGSVNAEKHNPPDYTRNRTPWLAVLTFTQDELALPQSTLTAIFAKVQGPNNPTPKQGPTFAVNVPVSEIANLQQTASPITYNESSDGADSRSDIILLQKALFTSLFSQYDATGKAITTSPYVYHHRYLAHKRDINSQGMAVSSASTDDDSGSFGVIFSHRSGPVDIVAPTAVYVHLVSIEGIEQMQPWPILDSVNYVAVSSLHSWSYMCLPPDTPTIRDEFVDLGTSISLLSPTISSNDPLFGKPGGPLILSRLQSGFSLSRYRTQTGEQTACMIRGPFVPTSAPAAQPWWPVTSMTGTDLQILDREVGIMDISYSAAWQLGRTMAIADQPFVTALTNVRRYITDNSQDQASAMALKAVGSFKSREDLLTSFGQTVDDLKKLHLSKKLTQPNAMLHRWFRPAADPLDLSRHGDELTQYLSETISQAAMDISSTPYPDKPTQPSPLPYDEYNTPFSVDWVVVLRWVLDRLFFDSIPSHYLLTDASHLPPESLKFFRIDSLWTDSMLDGALSLGNHYYQQSDPIRDAIKAAIVRYKTSKISKLGYLPAIPAYGCYIRSALITKFPDLIVAVEPAPAVTDPPILLGHQILDTGTMLCLFSEMPSSTTWSTLTFTQPPHQQTFIAADNITGPTPLAINANNASITIPANTITMSYRRAYTIPDPSTADPDHKISLKGAPYWTMDASGSSPVYCWTQIDAKTGNPYDVRTLLMDNLAPDYLKQLQIQMQPSLFSDTIASSALMAWQQNDPSYELDVVTPAVAPAAFKPETRAVAIQKPIAKPEPAARRPSTRPASRKLPDIPSVPHMTQEMRKAGLGSRPVLSPPPYQPPLRTVPIVPPKPSNGGTIGGPFKPGYSYYFYPTNMPTPGQTGSIPMGGVPQDILFSITLTTPAAQWQIQEIDIEINYGPPPKPGNPVLTFTNSPPGVAYMLSNLRFNPLVSFSNDKNTMLIRLLPRSTTGIVPVASCNELVFVLPSVHVNTSDITPYNILPTITEYYTNNQTFPITRNPNQTVPMLSLVPPAAV